MHTLDSMQKEAKVRQLPDRQERTVRYRDLGVKDDAYRASLLAAVEKVLLHGRLILGPEVEELEQKIAAYCRRKFCVAVSSGTDALYLALRVLNIGPGDEVITTPMSWIATTNAIVMTGATPVFVDIADDLNMDPQKLEDVITPKTRAIVPVHFTGRMCKMDAIMAVAKSRGIAVLEDAAQAFGAELGGRKAGNFGTIGCFSMNPMKVFCSYGEAGAVVMDDESMYAKTKALQYNGTINKEDCHYPSLNFKVDTIHAAMMLVELDQLERKIQGRIQVASFYDAHLPSAVGKPRVDDSKQVYYSYTILADRRAELMAYLKNCGIETKVQHPILMPWHTAYKGQYPCRIPVAEKLVQKILCIPNQDDLPKVDLEYVCGAINRFYAEGGIS